MLEGGGGPRGGGELSTRWPGRLLPCPSPPPSATLSTQNRLKGSNTWDLRPPKGKGLPHRRDLGTTRRGPCWGAVGRASQSPG